jgi:hypothetical protein
VEGIRVGASSFGALWRDAHTAPYPGGELSSGVATTEQVACRWDRRGALEHPLEVVQIRPMGGQADHDAARPNQDLRRHLVQQRAPVAWLALRQRVALAATLLRAIAAFV